MNRYVKLILNWPKLTILIFSIVTLILGAGIPKLGFNNAIEALMPHKDKEYHIYREIKKIYGNNDNFHIMSITHKQLWSKDTFSKLNDLITDLEEYENFNENKENERLKKFRSYISFGSISGTELIDHFKNDPPFQRLLMRKIANTVNRNEILSQKDLLKIANKIQATYDLKKNVFVDRIISPFTVQEITGHDDVLEVSDLIKTDGSGHRVLPNTPDEFKVFQNNPHP